MKRIVALSLLLLSFLIGQESPSLAVTSGLDFLKMGVGARPLALGEAYVALADDISAIYWNPAGLVQLGQPEVGFTYNKWFEDIGYHFFGYSHPLNDSIFALSLYYLGEGDIEGSDDAGNPTGEFSVYDLAFALSYGRKLTDRLSAGLNFKFIREKLEEEDANAFAFDLGALYKTGIDNLDLGLNIQNIGPRIKFVKESASLPLNWKFGLAYKLFPSNPLILTLDFNKLNNKGIYFGLGAECWIVDYLAVRIGSKFDPDIRDRIRFGLGLKVKNLRLDYAYTPHKILGDTHQFSVGFSFGELEEEEVLGREGREARMAYLISSLHEEGMAYLNQKQYIEAIAKFSEILLLDPEDKTALSKMKEANRLLMERK
ncbi:PorV/PorQ family protein [bacterium]|nr:PorV/PorQ family protein [bacterium]